MVFRLARHSQLGIAALFVVGNCSKSDPSPTGTAPPRDVATGAPVGAKAAPRGGAMPLGGGAAESSGSDKSFQLTAEQAAPTTAGGEAVARLRVHPGTGYKMNKDFPTKLTLEPPAGVTLTKTVPRSATPSSSARRAASRPAMTAPLP
jgi:hypothetical protein